MKQINLQSERLEVLQKEERRVGEGEAIIGLVSVSGPVMRNANEYEERETHG